MLRVVRELFPRMRLEGWMLQGASWMGRRLWQGGSHEGVRLRGGTRSSSGC